MQACSRRPSGRRTPQPSRATPCRRSTHPHRHARTPGTHPCKCSVRKDMRAAPVANTARVVRTTAWPRCRCFIRSRQMFISSVLNVQANVATRHDIYTDGHRQMLQHVAVSIRCVSSYLMSLASCTTARSVHIDSHTQSVHTEIHHHSTYG